MTQQERVDMWIKRLGGCPSTEDFLGMGKSLDSDGNLVESFKIEVKQNEDSLKTVS
jgi:hypothetical protein